MCVNFLRHPLASKSGVACDIARGWFAIHSHAKVYPQGLESDEHPQSKVLAVPVALLIRQHVAYDSTHDTRT